jgi:hypothetical protein
MLLFNTEEQLEQASRGGLVGATGLAMQRSMI